MANKIQPYSHMTVSMGPGQTPVPLNQYVAIQAGRMKPFSDMSVSNGDGTFSPASQWKPPAAAAPAPENPYNAILANPFYQGKKSALDTQANNQINGIGGISDEENWAGKDAGFTFSRDADGNPLMGSMKAEDMATNPFSKMALLQKSYQEHQRGTTNSYAAQGQLYSGALQGQRAEDKFQNDQGVDSVTKEFQRLLLGGIGKRRGIRDDNASSLADYAGSLYPGN